MIENYSMKFIKQIFSFLFNLGAWWSNLKRFKKPKKFGDGPHDCALVALHTVAPNISEDEIIDAFMYCAENWPYAGITNKEFNIAMKYLNLEVKYDDSDGQTVSSITQKKIRKCVALVHGHYIAVKKGKIIGKDANTYKNSNTKVYCSWNFLV